jgi:hypothetical protein
VLSNISPPRLRREASLFSELKSCWSHGRSLLSDQLQIGPSIRLRSRSVIWTFDPFLLQDGYRIVNRWRESWLSNIPVNGDIVDDAAPPGFDLKRREWVILNRFRTPQSKCAYLIHRWAIVTRVCHFGCTQQSTTHILYCPLRPFEGGLTVLHQVSSEAVAYLTNVDL